MKPSYGCDEKDLAHYTCLRTPRPIKVDGRLDKPEWQRATKSGRFVDLVSGAPGFLETRMAALWDDENLYVGFWIEEPNVRARLTERDSFVWTENDIEIFIGGEDCYYEFQMNALGTVYEVFYIWRDAYKRGSRFDIPEFNLLTRKVDVLGGFQDASRHGKHPRGARWAFMDWDFPGMKAAVQVAGTINDVSNVDRGWTAEVAFPWSGMKALAGEGPCRRATATSGAWTSRASSCSSSAGAKPSRTRVGPSTATASTTPTSPSASPSSILPWLLL
jgi:hypothetical protein